MSKWENITDLEKNKLVDSIKRFMINESRKDKIKKLFYDKGKR